MSGLTALLLAIRKSLRVLTFTNIKGNRAPEDCLFGRQIVSHPSDDPEVFFSTFIERTRNSTYHPSAIFAVNLRHKVQLDVVYEIFRSVVDLSDNGYLVAKFLSLPFLPVYMYGSRFAHFSYLRHIADHGIELAEIPASGHFTMYPIQLRYGGE